MSDQPLGLPEGSVRALLAIMIIGATIAIFGFTGVAPTELISMASVAFGYYFGARSAETAATKNTGT